MKKTLIIIDMQNDFLTGALANPTANEIVAPLVDFIKTNAFDYIVFTQDTHNAKEYSNSQEGKNLPVMHCEYLSKGWEVAEPLVATARKSKAVVSYISKPTFGFKYWGNLRELEQAGEIHICGTCTDICVMANVALIKTFFPETPIYVHANLCAGLTAHAHECALETMRSMQVNIVC